MQNIEKSDQSGEFAPAMMRDENGQLAGYVYVDTATSDIGGYVDRAKQAIGEHITLPAGYTLLWTGQYEFSSPSARGLQAAEGMATSCL